MSCGNAENQTRGCWVTCANATFVLCRPPSFGFLIEMLNFVLASVATFKFGNSTKLVRFFGLLRWDLKQ